MMPENSWPPRDVGAIGPGKGWPGPCAGAAGAVPRRPGAPPPAAGMLLTGGASRRMGFAKATLDVGGQPNAVRLAGALGRVAGPLVEVGPGYSGLPAVSEEPRGGGPLVALCAGAGALAALGHAGPALVVACDLPFVTAGTLGVLAAWPGGASVVPVAGGRPQPLCARWSASDLALARDLVAAGERAMRALLSAAAVEVLEESGWPGDAERLFADADTLSDLERLGLTPPSSERPSSETPG